MTSLHTAEGFAAHFALPTALCAALCAALWSPCAGAQAQATSEIRVPPPATTPAAPADKNAVEAAIATPTPVTPLADAATQRASARAALSAPQIDKLRPTGTIGITADRAELAEGHYAIYVGHVVLKSDTLNMDGARLELQQQPNGQFIATLTGAPAHMAHPSTGPDDPAVTAHADTLVYDSTAQLVTLTGNAQLTRGQNVVTGSTVRYNVSDHRVQASGGNGGQVHMVIQPPPPAPAPTEAPAASPKETP
ncbi:MAG: lipopolysaccharide transport periplasmic protein LptA [Nevskiaceae bacterium]|nr:MAG: lipopolysaccharide transport periplasmic protein LptA [Nevskiaceae bacterium]TBR73343.1 MAG: lipopolysaccharide transport periplasmic protein LptA [Nevskiaceae bacterium]